VAVVSPCLVIIRKCKGPLPTLLWASRGLGHSWPSVPTLAPTPASADLLDLPRDGFPGESWVWEALATQHPSPQTSQGCIILYLLCRWAG
jgi:hypothetical protein